MRYALRYPAVNVRAASWLDDDRFALNFKVSPSISISASF